MSKLADAVGEYLAKVRQSRDELDRQARALAGENERQKLATPLTEGVVNLDPSSAGGMTVGKRIGRVWALLWGKFGEQLKPLRIDRDGNLVISNDPTADLTYLGRFDDSTAGASVTIDIGEVADYIEFVAATNERLIVEASLDGASWIRSFVGDSMVYDGVGNNVVTVGKRWVRARYIRFTDLTSTNVAVEVAAYKR